MQESTKKELTKILLKLSWRNTLLVFFITVLYHILVDLHLDIGLEINLIKRYFLIGLFFSPIILLINLFPFILLINEFYKHFIANILAFTLPSLFSLIIYYCSFFFGNNPNDEFSMLVHSYLIINLLVRLFTIPIFVRKSNHFDKHKLRSFYPTTFGLLVSVLLLKLFYAPNFYSSKEKIFPPISLSVIDKSYVSPIQIKESEFINIDYRLTWFYNATERYRDTADSFDSQDYFDFKYKTLIHELNSNINYQKDEIYLTVAENEVDTINKMYKGLHLYLINSKTDTVNFEVLDDNFYIIQQAKDLLGNWQNIEQFLNSWCGNSYYNIAIPPNSYIRFTVPRYDGLLNTDLRFVLMLNQTTVLYSNSYSGKVNLGQFLINNKYLSSGILDPYY